MIKKPVIIKAHQSEPSYITAQFTLWIAVLSGITSIVNAYTINNQAAIASNNNTLQNCVFPNYRLDKSISVNNQSAIYPILFQQEKIITQKLNMVIDDTISILKKEPNWKKLKQSIKEIENAQREAISNLAPIKYVDVKNALNKLMRWTKKVTPAQRSAAIAALNNFKTEVSTSGYFVQRFEEGQNDTEQCNKHKQVLLYLTSLEDIIQIVRNSILNTPKLSTEATSTFQTASSIPSKSAKHFQTTNTPITENEETTQSLPKTADSNITTFVVSGVLSAVGVMTAIAGIGFFKKWRTGTYLTKETGEDLAKLDADLSSETRKMLPNQEEINHSSAARLLN